MTQTSFCPDITRTRAAGPAPSSCPLSTLELCAGALPCSSPSMVNHCHQSASPPPHNPFPPPGPQHGHPSSCLFFSVLEVSVVLLSHATPCPTSLQPRRLNPSSSMVLCMRGHVSDLSTDIGQSTCTLGAGVLGISFAITIYSGIALKLRQVVIVGAA